MSRAAPAGDPGAPGAAVAFRGVVHVYRAFGVDTAALRGVDLTVPAGQRVALLGPSGSGKSTLLTLLAGIRQPSAGRIEVAGTDIARLPEKELRGYRAGTVGTLFQGAVGNLLAYTGAAANVRFARRARSSSRRTPLPVASALLESVGLDRGDADTPVGRLSAGQQQMVALAVALANGPRLLIADEPTSQLDDEARSRVLDTLVDLADRAGTTVVVVTHDGQVAARMQRVVHLRDGRVGSEEHDAERLAVLGADRTMQLPDELGVDWAQGTRVRVTAEGPDEVRLTPVRAP